MLAGRAARAEVDLDNFHTTVLQYVIQAIEEVIMTAVRLPVDLEQKLDSLSNLQHKSKTEIIKEALEYFFYQEESEKDSYELGIKYFGIYGSGKGDLSTTYKSKLKDKINAKYNTH